MRQSRVSFKLLRGLVVRASDVARCLLRQSYRTDGVEQRRCDGVMEAKGLAEAAGWRSGGGDDDDASGRGWIDRSLVRVVGLVSL